MSKEELVWDGLQRCPYLPGRVARLPLMRQARRLDPDETDERLARAERRVGRNLYATRCPTCSACKGLRILVDAFEPSRSQRRVARRWDRLGDRLRIEVDRASWTDEKLDLFNRHKRERGLAEEGEEPMDAYGYVGWLLDSCMETVEMRYLIDDTLVAVGILDLGRTASSSVYFYFDPRPEVARLSPGVYSTLREVAYARQTGRIHHYLGLWVERAPKLSYKADFAPHERLIDGAWRRFDRR